NGIAVLAQNLQGKLVLFDNIICAESGTDKPFQFIGWRIEIDGSYSLGDVPANLPQVLPGFIGEFYLNGVLLSVGQVLRPSTLQDNFILSFTSDSITL